MSPDSVLVVDDEKSWRDIYEAAAHKVGVSTVRAAATLNDALAEISAKKFSVAVVDIGLDESDDTNIDGLAVLSKIRSVGDETSILVVTGRVGQDLISIISDAIKKYGAQHTMAKSIIEPRSLRTAVEAGLDTYRKTTAGSHLSGYSELRGASDQMIWDDRMMRILGLDARDLYNFVGKVIGSFMPLAESASGATLGSSKQDGVAHGAFWSRAVGAPIVVLMGREPTVNDVMKDVSDGGRILDTYEVTEVIRTYSESGAMGAVLRLSNNARSDFVGG